MKKDKVYIFSDRFVRSFGNIFTVFFPQGPNREEVLKKVTGILDELTKEDEASREEKKSVDEKSAEDPISIALEAYNNIKVPDKVVKDVPFTVLNYALEKSGKLYFKFRSPT